MDFVDFLAAPWDALGAAVVSTAVIYLWVVAATRVLGLRSFAKMSSFDFAATIATGSVLASTATTTTPLVQGMVTVAALFAAQAVIMAARRRSPVQAVVDNEPVLLMDGPRFMEDNMRATRVQRSDIIAKLREANVTRLEQVRCVVLETTGDVSVLHADPEAPEVDEVLLEGVRRR